MKNSELQCRLLHPLPGETSWAQLRDEAAVFAEHGWPVHPGTFQIGGKSNWLGRPDTYRLEPVAASWEKVATTDSSVAARWWSRRPYSLLLACGRLVDAFEVHGDLGRLALELLGERGVVCPAAQTPAGTWLFFAGRRGVSGTETSRVRHHGVGAWVPLPPTAAGGFAYEWRVSPHSVGWHLADGARVCGALVEVGERPAVMSSR
ncbi:bifunctional DNA primase/polymerase [Saccharopolyspora thermophila]